LSTETIETVKCKSCGEEKPRSDFVRDRTRKNKLFPWCKVCHADRQRDYRKVVIPDGKDGPSCPQCGKPMGEAVHANRRFCSDKCKDRFRALLAYGLLPEEFKLLTESGKCPICLRIVTKWDIDHNHTTGETYGAVCTSCNQGILAGSWHDIEKVKRLLAFLESPPVRNLVGSRRYTGPERSSQEKRDYLWKDLHAHEAGMSA
jgi:hypothetical protein